MFLVFKVREVNFYRKYYGEKIDIYRFKVVFIDFKSVFI